jgi:hypothetical protein
MNSLFDPVLLLFIFAPPLLTLALVLAILWWKARKQSAQDFASRSLAAALQCMPAERAEWGQAMLAELNHLEGRRSRFCFEVGCVRKALFPPAAKPAPIEVPRLLPQSGIHCGMLSVALPPMALPFLFVSALVADAIFHGMGDSTSHAMPAALLSACLLTGLTLLLSGLPLGLAGWYRGERFLWLSALGPALSIAFTAYLWIFLQLFALGPNGD